MRTWANSVIAHRFARSLIFLKVGFRLRSSNYAAQTDPDERSRVRDLVQRKIGDAIETDILESSAFMVFCRSDLDADEKGQ